MSDVSDDAGQPSNAGFLASFEVMMAILVTGAMKQAARYTGLAAAAATFLLKLFDSASGFCLNPARSLVSAVPSGHWDGFWIYFLAPPAGMVLAAFVHQRVLSLLCAKLVHDGSTRCIHCILHRIRRERAAPVCQPALAGPAGPA